MGDKFIEQVDAFDLILHCLAEHEKSLDASAAKLEEVSGMVPVSGLLKPVGNSVYLLIPKEIAVRYGLKVGDHIQAYVKRA